MERAEASARELLTSHLRDVSRSFYLTLRVLPGSVRPQIGLAYLLARTTDTIADTGIVPVDQRLHALRALRDRILGAGAAPLDFGELARRQGSPAERLILEKCEDTLSLLRELPDADRRRVREVLEVIVSGQELDLQRFAGASPGNITALRTDADLDDYTYRVAGCVGEFWTKMCRAHVFPRARLDDAVLVSNGIRFGKGLQLVNILRDVSGDLAQGRCYLPSERLAGAGLSPADLLDPGNEPRLRPLYNAHLDRAQGHLCAGWSYTNTLPWRHARVRLACAWPILIGVRTLQRLRSANPLDARQRIKISRGEVKRLMLQSILFYPCPPLWRRLARFEAKRGG